MKASVQLIVSLALLGFLLGAESAPPSSAEAESEASPDARVPPQIMRVDLPEQEILALQDRLRKTRQISPQALSQQQSPAAKVSPQLDAQQRLLAEQILRQQLQQRAQQSLLKKQRVQKQLEQMLRNQIKEQQVLKQKLEREIFNEQLKAKARQAEKAIADKKAMQQRAVLPENILLQRQLNNEAYPGQPKVQVQREIVPADQLLFELERDQVPQEQFLQPSYRPGPPQVAVSAGPLVVPGNAGGGSNYFQTPRNLNGYDGPAQYSFEYKVQDAQYANDFGHRETRDGDRTEGTYYVNLPDGRLQRVDYYVTGDSGFVADVTYQGEPQYPQGPAGGYGPVQPNYA